MDENGSAVDVGDEDDLLADGEGIPKDGGTARLNELATCKCVQVFA